MYYVSWNTEEDCCTSSYTFLSEALCKVKYLLLQGATEVVIGKQEGDKSNG